MRYDRRWVVTSTAAADWSRYIIHGPFVLGWSIPRRDCNLIPCTKRLVTGNRPRVVLLHVSVIRRPGPWKYKQRKISHETIILIDHVRDVRYTLHSNLGENRSRTYVTRKPPGFAPNLISFTTGVGFFRATPRAVHEASRSCLPEIGSFGSERDITTTQRHTAQCVIMVYRVPVTNHALGFYP